MQLGRVIGAATASLKHQSMKGWKLLLVQPHMADGATPDGDPVLAVDGVGAGRGETVLITSDRRWSREMLKTQATPVCWTIIGIRDE